MTAIEVVPLPVPLPSVLFDCQNTLTYYVYCLVYIFLNLLFRDTINSVFEESEIVRTEKIKIDLYNKFSSNGLVMEKKDFESLFNLLRV